jgi:8-oxo-dGTP pyrophosphatase MutT (NUDIX family)
VSLHLDPELVDTVPVRPAATVMLVRDAPTREDGCGVEVCMLQRNLQSDFVGGAFVFPGGGVDPEDGEPEVEGLCIGRTDRDASAQLGLPTNGLAFWVAAIRESFEEAGVLAATHADGEPLRLDDPVVAARFARHRRAVDQRERRLIEVCAEEDLRLHLDQMHYFGHWITPPGAPRRYDTRFFLAAAPPGQHAVHDDREVIATRWVHPIDALAAHTAGAFAMLPPTVASLRSLCRFGSATDALAAAAEATSVPTMAPRVLADEGGMRIVLPGDPDYDRAYAGDNHITSWPGVNGESSPAASNGSSASDEPSRVPAGQQPVGMADIDVTGAPSPQIPR